jgi:hypothetical protein
LVNYQLRAVAERAVSALGLSGPLAEQLLALHTAQQQVADELEPDRVLHFETFLTRVEALLEPARYRTYVSTLEQHFTELQLAPRRSRAREFRAALSPQTAPE